MVRTEFVFVARCLDTPMKHFHLFTKFQSSVYRFCFECVFRILQYKQFFYSFLNEVWIHLFKTSLESSTLSCSRVKHLYDNFASVRTAFSSQASYRPSRSKSRCVPDLKVPTMSYPVSASRITVLLKKKKTPKELQFLSSGINYALELNLYWKRAYFYQSARKRSRIKVRVVAPDGSLR